MCSSFTEQNANIHVFPNTKEGELRGGKCNRSGRRVRKKLEAFSYKKNKLN